MVVYLLIKNCSNYNNDFNYIKNGIVLCNNLKEHTTRGQLLDTISNLVIICFTDDSL